LHPSLWLIIKDCLEDGMGSIKLAITPARQVQTLEEIREVALLFYQKLSGKRSTKYAFVLLIF
jgi:soluble cytochrome b562